MVNRGLVIRMDHIASPSNTDLLDLLYSAAHYLIVEAGEAVGQPYDTYLVAQAHFYADAVYNAAADALAVKAA